MKEASVKWRWWIVAVAAIVVLSAGGAAVIAGDPGQPMMGGHGAKGDMMDSCRAMMAQHKEMKEKLASMDAEMDGMLEAMDAARGKQKTEVMARVIRALVEQMRQGRSMMMQGRRSMMQHMMRHMKQGMAEGMADMSECPMMKKMMQKEGGESGGESHAKHHP